jgi:hypothetical protein
MITDEHIPASVRGMDAVLHITEWEPYTPARVGGPPELCWPADGGECEWRLLSTTGRRCRRVEASLTDAERQRLDDAAYDALTHPT